MKTTYTFTCQKCGKEYQLELTQSQYLNGRYSKFCSKSCARTRSEESKTKIRESLNKTRAKIRLHICPKCGKEFQASGTASNKYCQKCKSHPNRYERNNIGLHSINCQDCGKLIYVKDQQAKYCFDCCKKNNYYHYAQFDKDGKKLYYPQTKEKLSNKAKQLMRQGIIKPWQSRNITSYPQQFFIEVLKQNNISYQREKHVGKYFLDFVIQTSKGKIDLQIDGKQHWMIQTQMLSDKIKDEYITNQGYIVYRIKWNQINTEKGKQQMEEKINQFLEFIKD